MNRQIGQLVTIAFLLVSLCGCQRPFLEEEETEVSSNEKGNFIFSTGFFIQNSLLRGTEPLSDYATTINWYDFQTEALKSDIVAENIDQLEIPLDNGMHQLFFVAHSAVSTSFSNETNSFSSGKVTDTFWGDLQLEVNEGTEREQNISLKRVVGKILLQLTDAIPEEAKFMQLTINGYCAFLNVKTGVGAEKECKDYTYRWTYKSGNIGQKNTTYSVFTYIPSDSYKVGMRVNILDESENVIYSRKISDIPVKMNQTTTLVGEIFSGEKKFSFSFSPEWDTGTSIPF